MGLADLESADKVGIVPLHVFRAFSLAIVPLAALTVRTAPYVYPGTLSADIPGF